MALSLYRNTTLFLICSYILLNTIVFAHPHSTPIRSTLLVEEDLENSNFNKGGYGYIASSEAESYASFEFGCSERQIHNYYSCSSGITLLDPSRAKLEELSKGISSQILLQRLREQMAEKIILERAALTNEETNPRHQRSNWPNRLPRCLNVESMDLQNNLNSKAITPYETRNRLLNLHRNLPKGMTSQRELKEADPEKRTTLKKFNSIINSNSSGNLVRAVMLHDQLDARRKYFCKMSNRKRRSTDFKHYCVDLQNQVQRLKDSYPILFGKNSNSATSEALNKTRDAIYDLLGANARAGTSRRQRRLGKLRYEAHTTENILNGGSTEWKIFEKTVAEKVKEAHEIKNNPPISKGKHTRMANALDNLNSALKSVKETYKTGLQKKLDDICKLDLKTIIEDHPNVVRQAMADFNVQGKSLMKFILCSNNYLKKIAPIPQCRGIKKSSDSDGEHAKVNRKSSTWPYYSENVYDITYPSTPVGAPPVVKLDLYFPTTMPRGDENEGPLDTFIEKFKADVEGYYNCSSGNKPPNTFGPISSGCLDMSSSCGPDRIETFPRINCPPHPGMPKIKFEFNFTPQYLCPGKEPTTRPCIKSLSRANSPQMVIHNCYNADLDGDDATDCTKVKEHSVKKCTKIVTRIMNTGRFGQSTAPEFDDYLENIINPFVTKTSSSTRKRRCGPGTEETPSTDTTHCNSLKPKKMPSGTIIDCKTECENATKECRPPKFICWSEDMAEQVCNGKYKRSNSSFGNPEIPEGHPKYNRADSGNLSTGVHLSTFLHEVGHVLNLDDEYQDPTYPFLPPGEHDSMMNNSGPNSRFYPRQFKKILEPARCVGIGPFNTSSTGGTSR